MKTDRHQQRLDVDRGRIHLTVGEERDHALMLGGARVLVDQFVQRGTGRHGVQEQDEQQPARIPAMNACWAA